MDGCSYRLRNSRIGKQLPILNIRTLSKDELYALEEDGPEWKYEAARFLEEAVQEPDAIFAGLRRAGQQASHCYSVRIVNDPDEPDQTTHPRYGHVFLVFIREGTWGYVAFIWSGAKKILIFQGTP